MEYVLIDAVELEDYAAAIVAGGKRPEHFVLTETLTAGLCGEVGIATILHTPSGVVRSYPIGNGSIFPADFTRDVMVFERL